MIVSRSIFLLIMIWGFYAILSFYDLSFGFDNPYLLLYPSLNTIILIICFILSFLIGSVIFNLNNYSAKYKSYTSYYKLSFQLEKKIFYFCIIGYFSILLIIYLRKFVYLNFFDIKLSRTQIYSFTYYDVYTIRVINTFLNFTKSILLSFLYFFFIKFLFQKKYFEITLIFVGIILESFIFNSRGNFLSLVFFLMLFLFLIKSQKVNIKFILTITLVIFVITLLAFIITLLRGHFSYQFISQFILYLKISPTLLSSVVDNNLQVFYNKWSIENIFAIFSGLDYLISIILRGIGIPIQTYGYEIVKFLDTTSVVGQSLTYQKFIEHNTFYSILLEPYLSFGFLGVVLFGFATGYFISKHEYIYSKYNCYNSLFWLQFLSSNIAFGILGSFFSTVNFWLVLVIFLYFKKFIFIKKFHLSND
jgi:oligosaccharide repeat unit polymerase